MSGPPKSPRDITSMNEVIGSNRQLARGSTERGAVHHLPAFLLPMKKAHPRPAALQRAHCGARGIKAGFAERDITPEVGMEVPGVTARPSATHHDPCKARRGRLRRRQMRVALVGLDALGVPRSLVLAARAKIAERLRHPGRDDRRVPFALLRADHHDPAGRLRPRIRSRQGSRLQQVLLRRSRYLAKVRDAIVEAVVAANDARSAGTASFGSGREETVAFNRRIRMKNGLSFSHPGKGNPDNVESPGRSIRRWG